MDDATTTLTEKEIALLDALKGGTPTKRQTELVKAIAAGGFTVTKVEMIGKRLWVVAERLYLTPNNPVDGCIFLNEDLYGTIGPRGALNLTYNSFTFKDKIDEPWKLRSRLDEWKWRNPANKKEPDNGTPADRPAEGRPEAAGEG